MPFRRNREEKDGRFGDRPDDWDRDIFDDPFFDMKSDMFRDFDDRFRRMRAYMDGMMEKAASGTLQNPGQGGPFVYGWSMRVGPDGVPRVQTFGNVSPRAMRGERALGTGEEGARRRAQGAGPDAEDGDETEGEDGQDERGDGPEDVDGTGGPCAPEGMTMPGVREPLTDICEGEREFKVIAEMPGIEKDHIELETGDDFIVIKAEKGERRFYKDLPLNARVVPESARARFNNGVLEITIDKAQAEKKGTKVKVE